MKDEREGFAHDWETESLRYFSLPDTRPPRGALPSEIIKFLEGNHIETVLDVGCGNGTFLHEILRELSVAFGVGVEPSKETVKELRARWSEQSELTFQVAAAENLPFADQSFDLVIAWSVLHWISREHYLQALGEMVRVTNRYLLVMDFCPLANYRTPYKHREGRYTYKADFSVPLGATDILEPLVDIRFIQNGLGELEILAPADLMPLYGNSRNWLARRCNLYEKSLGLPHLFLEQDFHEGTE